jgi:hypothetical protein
MSPESLDRLELKDLGLPDSFLKPPQRASNGESRHQPKSGGFRFYQFSIKVLEDIAEMTGCAPLIVLLALYRLHFHSFRQNPVRLTSESLRNHGLSRHQKRRALSFLEKTGHITVQRQHRKNPLVTLNWLPIRK